MIWRENRMKKKRNHLREYFPQTDIEMSIDLNTTKTIPQSVRRDRIASLGGYVTSSRHTYSRLIPGSDILGLILDKDITPMARFPPFHSQMTFAASYALPRLSPNFRFPSRLLFVEEDSTSKKKSKKKGGRKGGGSYDTRNVNEKKRKRN
jgi:hypothetical protein